jgi:hypothetical protein
MSFLSEILDRPKNERPFVLIPVGFPAADAVGSGNREKAVGGGD